MAYDEKMITEILARKQLIEISRLFYARSWSLATSGNYSARLDEYSFLITATGKDKGELREADFAVVHIQEDAIPNTASAEAVLHRELYRLKPDIGAILHTHSTFSTVLSMECEHQISLRGYEMQKALSGIGDPENEVTFRVFPNHQNMSKAAAEVHRYYENSDLLGGFLFAGHGLYSVGANLAEAKRHTEALEFLLECEWRRRIIKLNNERRKS
jgi:methylthioribulose-1-phosphate dehydratase